MLTQCPSCQTVFRVTSTILRAAHGQVRCGRCNTQFDAIEYLLEGDDAQVLETTGTQSQIHVGERIDEQGNDKSDEFKQETLEHEDIVLEGNRIEISGIYQRPDAADDDHAMHARTIIEEFNISTEEWENPFEPLSETDALDSDETEVEDVEQEINAASLADAINSLDTETPPPTLAPATMADTEQESEVVQEIDPSAASREPSSGLAASDTSTPLEPEVATTAAVDDTPFDTPFISPTPSRRWPWVIASALLMAVLAAQAIHHSRETLARHPSIGPQLSKLYAAIGQPLTPEWQLQAYTIKQWGIVADPQNTGTLRVRASITNHANFAQPYPLLQLSLEDRFGSKVGTREFTPQEYLDNAAQATRLLAAGEAANVDLTIVDPGQDAVGFQFDTCLQLGAGLRCAHELQL